ncbi:hypothetical protein GOP47_0000379 [Adiantum capillus-veneris]|uniref:Uncharacterized protein n=1 Tax=Adiantum capillus-veneris TaxID=13818 RepID=A0A9D4VCX3_ADICA|nr:hypothetical protein GOP47_0000379 [Adiantum capillus-veneris]
MDMTKAVVAVEEDPYRKHMLEEAEKETEWRHGTPPSYDVVNALFQQMCTQDWPKGSLEQVVQDLVKSWEMELSHKTRAHHFKTIHPEKFRFSVNGGQWMSTEETLKICISWWVCMGGLRGVLGSSNCGIQVEALGYDGGALQRTCSNK